MEFIYILQRKSYYHQTSNIRHTLVGNEIVDPSDVVGASPVNDAGCSSNTFILDLTPGLNWAKIIIARPDRNISTFWDLVHLIPNSNIKSLLNTKLVLSVHKMFWQNMWDLDLTITVPADVLSLVVVGHLQAQC